MSRPLHTETGLVPLSHPLGNGTAGQTAERGTNTGTLSLKTLASRVLERDSSRDKHRDSVSHGMGQAHGLVGQAGQPESSDSEVQFWRDFFAERCAFLEFDCGDPREVAERRALDDAVSEFLARMSAEHGDPAKCMHCNGEKHGKIIPFIGENLSGLWVHEACAAQWKKARHDYAVSHLKSMGVGND